MIRFLVLSVSPRLIRSLAAAVAAATALPVSFPAHAQIRAGYPANAAAAEAEERAASDAKRRERVAERQSRQEQDDSAPIDVSAERLTGRPDRELELQGNVEVRRGGTTFQADRARYDIIRNLIDASGDIRMQRYGDRYTGNELQMNMDSGRGYLLNPTYRLELSNARGDAERVDFESEDVATVTGGTYSTCEGPTPDWYLKAGTLRLDQGRDIGFATGTVVYFKGVPILGAPVMTFPLSGERKSGVLPPTIGTTSRSGLEVLLPYYFNIAPNRDLTLYPRLISKRGLQLGAAGRYLGESYSGRTTIEGMVNDREAGTNRWAYTSLHTQTLAPGLNFGWNLSGASDDDYPTDFSNTLTAAQQRLLLRDFNINYAGAAGGAYWNAVARATNYQVLQDPLAPIAKPYARLPQVTLTAARQDLRGFDWSVETDFTRFSHPDLIDADRLYITPRVAYPILRPGYFITPRIALDATTYRLDRAAGTVGTPRSINRVVPIFSVDAGLTFERDTSLFGQTMTQTLEPRVFYVKTPYRDQSRIPLFDTARADFNFAQLFTENRFVGHDRIADADQLTTAVTSRYIENNGVERMRLAIGQRFNFRDPQVGIIDRAPDESRSDLLLAASGRLSSTVTVDANVQYSQSLGQMNRDNYGVRWQPGPAKVLNLQYRRDQASPELLQQLEQIDVSAQWPISRRWYAVGRVNFSLEDRFLTGPGQVAVRRNKVAESLLGVEYKADCWIFRVVAQRIPTATERANSAIFVQLELNGLSSIGSNPLQSLRANVPGYQNVNQLDRSGL